MPNAVSQIAALVAQPSAANQGYIIPLYIYPAWWTNPGAWNWVYTAAANYPSITFTVIVNPASGPGTAILPNSDYQQELAKLTAISNVQILGYVDTAYGSRSTAAVTNDISLYAGWNAANSAIDVDGIYFDNQASGQSYLSMYTSYASQVRNSAALSPGIVGFGPGQVCYPGFVDIADFVVIFESTSAIVKDNIFGWYSSFLTGLNTSQLSKLVWMLSAADQTTTLAVTNLQAALNPKYLFLTDSAGQWGAQFQGAPGASFLTKALGLISSPLSMISSLVAT